MAFTLTPELTFLVGLLVFWAVLYLIARIFHLDKHGLDVRPGYFIFRSKALNSSIDRVAKKHPTLWTGLSNIGLAFSVGLMALSIYFLVSNLLSFTQKGDLNQFALAIPGLTINLYWLPFFIFAVVVVILPHELAHGIMARLANIPVLSTGILAFVVLFGAFVEPDEKEFEKTPLIARLRMLSVGSSANLVTALIVLVMLGGLFAPPAGVLIHETMPSGPLEGAGLGRWDVIEAINDRPVTGSNFTLLTLGVKPGENLTLTVLHDNRVERKSITTIAAEENKSRAIIGLVRWSNYLPDKLGLDQYTGINLYWVLFWVYLLGFNVAVFNMLPLYPFDGERILYYPLERLVKKRKRELRIAISCITLGLFALNLILSLWIYGLSRL